MRSLIIASLLIVFQSPARAQDDINAAPIRYSQTRGNNAVTRLFDSIHRGEIELEYRRGNGYVDSLLAAWNIPVESQCLVYSKTSLQAGRISPSNPRAIYFGDDVYVGWIRGSSLLEIAVADPVLGAVFYTVRMSPAGPAMRRQNNACLAMPPFVEERRTDSATFDTQRDDP